MQITPSFDIKNKYTMPFACDNSPKYKKETLPESNEFAGLKTLAAQNAVICKKDKFNAEKLEELNIPNFAYTCNEGIRGESLSSKRNRKFLKPIKNAGIETVIDLRDGYTSKNYRQMCNDCGLKYYNFPVDSSSVDDRTIIDNMPLMFDAINRGRFYIACAQGLHRTDIALAINYVFNPKAIDVPEMRGHFRDYGFKTDDISRRLNSIHGALTKEDLKKIGWDDTFEEEFTKRKSELIRQNREIAQKKLQENETMKAQKN
ncbi:MAG: hypothetical protein LUE64_03005 [Candidatus Gastranaerophilales bacterium]|nr:hypothetical protein [Candidatus Gastranaerophilales bacterium]